MRLNDLLTTAAARLLRPAAACLLLAAASAVSSAQTQDGDGRAPAQSTQATQPTQPTPEAGATADEEFELNIDSRRISEKDFHAATAVETDGARGLHVGVGVALRASDIEVLLRNVRGRVRFRASLAPVLRLLDARRAAPTQTPPP